MPPPSSGHDPDASYRWKNLFDFAADAIVLGSSEGIILEANDEACRLTGYSTAELVGRPIEDFFSPEEQARVPLNYRDLMKGLVIRNSRMLNRRDGTVFPVEMSTKLMPDGVFQTYVRDITESLRAERELKLSEEKFAKAFRTSPDSVAINRLSDGMYLEINDGFEAMTGYTPAEVIGRRSVPGDLGIWVKKEDREHVVALLNRGEPVRGLEAQFRRKDGGIIIGSFSARQIEIQGVPCLLSITRDITEKKHTEEALRNAQKLESLGVLAGGIAHDFNNLLTGVFGYVSTARELIDDGHPARQGLDRALDVFDRAKALSHQLLTFAKGGAPVKTLLVLPALLQSSAQFALSGSNVKAELRMETGLWACEADVYQIGQVLDNLILNARQAMPEGGTVTIAASNVADPAPVPLGPGPWVKIEVGDRGVGIPQAHLSQVFDPFFTTKAQGTGLGLATAFSIVKRHGGLLKVDSEVGKGSKFTFHLPASLDTVETAPQTPQERHVCKGSRILLLDDEPFILEIGRRLLENWGCQISVAVNAFEVLKLYTASLRKGPRFDLVILDLTIPGGEGGVQILEQLKRLDPRVRAVASSGYSDDPVMAVPLRYGFLGSLPKPYRSTEFQELLDRLL